MQYVRIRDLLETDQKAGIRFDLSPFEGIWLNTDSNTRGVVKLLLSIREGDLMVRVFGECKPSPCDWGEVRAGAIYSDSAGSEQPVAFIAFYDFGFMETQVQANLNQGLLVVGFFNTFKDESNRSDYFSREFFHKQANAPQASDL